ncbi:hypothetical protein ABK040_008686 [Willaertia magna]
MNRTRQKAIWQTFKLVDELKQNLIEIEQKLRGSLKYKIGFIAFFSLVGYIPYEIRRMKVDHQPSIITLATKTYQRTPEKKERMNKLFE